MCLFGVGTVGGIDKYQTFYWAANKVEKGRLGLINNVFS